MARPRHGWEQWTVAANATLGRPVPTAKGARPRAGGFHRARARWAPFRDEVRPRTLAILQEGVKLHWNGPVPLPLWLENQRMTMEQQQVVDIKVEVLLQTAAIYPLTVPCMGHPFASYH